MGVGSGQGSVERIEREWSWKGTFHRRFRNGVGRERGAIKNLHLADQGRNGRKEGMELEDPQSSFALVGIGNEKEWSWK
jgi:hypothetical protein